MTDWNKMRELRDYLLTLPPERVRMDKVLIIDKDEETVAQARQVGCGTVGCIAGHASLVFGPSDLVLHRDTQKRPYVTMHNLKYSNFDAWEIAADGLGLDDREAHYVFYGAWHSSAPEVDDDEGWIEYVEVDHLGEIAAADVIAYLSKAIEEQSIWVSL